VKPTSGAPCVLAAVGELIAPAGVAVTTIRGACARTDLSFTLISRSFALVGVQEVADFGGEVVHLGGQINFPVGAKSWPATEAAASHHIADSGAASRGDTRLQFVCLCDEPSGLAAQLPGALSFQADLLDQSVRGTRSQRHAGSLAKDRDRYPTS
jgi:hypothetical protein